MFGVGIDDILLDAYEWLIEEFLMTEMSCSFLVSVGRITARSL